MRGGGKPPADAMLGAEPPGRAGTEGAGLAGIPGAGRPAGTLGAILREAEAADGTGDAERLLVNIRRERSNGGTVH